MRVRECVRMCKCECVCVRVCVCVCRQLQETILQCLDCVLQLVSAGTNNCTCMDMHVWTAHPLMFGNHNKWQVKVQEGLGTRGLL